MPDDWAESTEGDLDPDLTDEAGYSNWNPPDRARWMHAGRLLLLMLLLALIGGVVLAVAAR